MLWNTIRNSLYVSDAILINDFSRTATVASNLLSGPLRLKRRHVMAEKRNKKNVVPERTESASTSNNHRSSGGIRSTVPDHLSGLQDKRKKDSTQWEESMRYNMLPTSQVNPYFVQNYGTYPPYQNVPYYLTNYNNLSYRNYYQAVLQPNLRYHCFHRNDPTSQQRNLQTAAKKENRVSSMNGLRYWEKVSGDKDKPGFTFSVMSYNVLAQDLIALHSYLYAYNNQRALSWEVRWNNIIGEIRKLNPDILCLQEVQYSHLDRYFSTLETLGYRGVYKQRTGWRSDGCAIYYKKDLLTMNEYVTVEYNQPSVSLLDRDNVAIIARFSQKDNPVNEFLVATTHLLYNPKRQDVRLAQTQLLLTEVDRMAFCHGSAASNSYIPTIITGDLNSDPDSVVYQFITKGEIRYEHLTTRSLQNNNGGPKTGKQFLPKSLRITDQCQHADLVKKRGANEVLAREDELKLIEITHSERECNKDKNREVEPETDQDLFSSGTLSHNFSLKSVYTHRRNGYMEGTTFQEKWTSVDYIFYSNQRTNLGKLTLLERYKLPTSNQLGNLKIPNEELGSDHLSLIAKFKLNH